VVTVLAHRARQAPGSLSGRYEPRDDMVMVALAGVKLS